MSIDRYLCSDAYTHTGHNLDEIHLLGCDPYARLQLGL